MSSLDSGAEVVVPDASVPWWGGMQSSSRSEGLELRDREQDQNHKGETLKEKKKHKQACLFIDAKIKPVESGVTTLQGQRAVISPPVACAFN